MPARRERSVFLDSVFLDFGRAVFLLRCMFSCRVLGVASAVRGARTSSMSCTARGINGAGCRRGELFFEIAVNVYALVDACTHECTAHDTVYDGALEAEPRLLQQTRTFCFLSLRRPIKHFKLAACGVATRASRRAVSLGRQSQNLSSPIPFQTH
jgi:hypothetical protein